MFRGAQANPMDDAIVRSTDENLTSENWEYILDVVDRVAASPSGPQQAVASIIKRLAHRNANVQLYTLELANALSQNCGAPIHRELASKAFTDALLRLAGDRNTHGQVKQKVLERMGVWTEEFGRQPDFGIMEQAYQKLRREQPGLMPPSKPVKQEISVEEKRKEEEELQMALALSIKDGQQKDGGGRKASADRVPAQTEAAPPQSSQGTTAATVSRVRALYDFTPSESGELAFRKNDIIAVLESVYRDWWRGSLRGQSGIFPLNYVEKLQDPTREELERDAQMEGEVFGEIKNVERLLSLLTVRGDGGRRGEREEEEIGELYQRTLSIRPKLIELIGKYSQKKDDFTQLNEKFIKARRDYEALLESSMSQLQYQQQQQQQQQQYPVRPRPQQAPYQTYAPQQQPSYGAPRSQIPPSGYLPQNQPPTGPYPPQPQFAPQQSQQHLPPQQDVQRYYSPAPSEPPTQQPVGYSSPYPQSDGPPALQPSNGGAPFHFIPGGVQGGPPPQQQQQQLQPQPQQQEIRRKPSPQDPNPSSNLQIAAPRQQQQQQQPFQGQIRPNSIHTLNSGNPSELGTGGYESPVDNRHSYPSGQQMGAQQGGYDAYGAQQYRGHYPLSQPPPPPPPQQQQAPPPSQVSQQQQQQQRDDRDHLPSRRRTQSFESPSSTYASSQIGSVSHGAWDAQQHQHQQQEQQSPVMLHAAPQQQQQQTYQAYQPQQQASVGGSEAGGGGDPGDFYR